MSSWARGELNVRSPKSAQKATRETCIIYHNICENWRHGKSKAKMCDASVGKISVTRFSRHRVTRRARLVHNKIFALSHIRRYIFRKKLDKQQQAKLETIVVVWRVPSIFSSSSLQFKFFSTLYGDESLDDNHHVAVVYRVEIRERLFSAFAVKNYHFRVRVASVFALNYSACLPLPLCERDVLGKARNWNEKTLKFHHETKALWIRHLYFRLRKVAEWITKAFKNEKNCDVVCDDFDFVVPINNIPFLTYLFELIVLNKGILWNLRVLKINWEFKQRFELLCKQTKAKLKLVGIGQKIPRTIYVNKNLPGISTWFTFPESLRMFDLTHP